MEIPTLEAKKRTVTGPKVNNLREANIVPAVVYGHGITPQNLQVGYLSLEKIYEKAGESSLVDLKIDGGEPVKVVIYDLQRDPLTEKITHADFYQVNLKEKIAIEVPLKFIGESPAVKGLGGTLVKGIDELEIECLPMDLIHEIEVDLSGLKNFGDAIHIRDIKLPAGLSVKGRKAEEVLAVVVAPKTEEEMKKELEGAEVEAGAVEKVVVEGEAEKKEGEEAAAKKEEKKERE